LDEMPADTIVARVRPDNRSSQNVALKAGLHPVAERAGRGCS
jgi:RimJ/RimL family protein N-acetyltransferase